MLLQILKVKIMELMVSESNANYSGSISLPEELLLASGIKPFEQVHVNNKTNGNRIVTYAVKSKSPGRVTVNGAASKLFNNGDVVHILAYAYLTVQEAENHQPVLVLADADNRLLASKTYVFDEI